MVVLGNSRQPGERWPQQRVTASAHGWGHRDGREAQTLGLAGAQTTQLLVEPSWRPAVLWDRVTLTCQGSGTAGATTWYKDGQRWGQERGNNFTVTESGTYTCDRPGSGLSHPVNVSNDQVVLQVPVRALLEGETLTLRCRYRREISVDSVFFYHGDTELGRLHNRTELSLSPLQLNHSGRYCCKAWVKNRVSWGWEESMPVIVTVHELVWVLVLEAPPEPTQGSPLTLSCLSSPSLLRPQAPLLHVFYRDRQVVGGPQGSLQLLVPTMEVSHSGNYSCQVHSEVGAMRKSSAWLRVTVHTPVANATITLIPLSHQVHPGDSMTLHCLVQVGSAPVTFTWLHNGQEVARGPLLQLGALDEGHSGTYQCVATNQLDGHQALSPELALEVTPWRHRDTVAAGVGWTLFFLLLLVGVIVAWHRWHRVAARKHQERAPPRHYPSGTSGDLRGAVGTPRETTGVQ
uniref:Fc receptor-like protein 4 n=1 Tax=Agelaius phoeniceus TaxID=39638 RepID=UPI0023EBBCCA|nr:Fc receptor-like protein 4 [Agelaius phoeniceus]